MDDILSRSVERLREYVNLGDWATADRELQYLTGAWLRARAQGADTGDLKDALADLRMWVMTENDVPQVIGPAEFGWMLASTCSVVTQAEPGKESSPPAT